MPKLSYILAAAALAGALFVGGPAVAQDTELERIPTMSNSQLAILAAKVLVTVSLDARKLQPAAQRGDCAELTRTFNSLNLAYDLLGQADSALKGRPAREVLATRVQVVQARVVAFASRVRAEEWHMRICRSFVAPPELADDVRYATPVPVATKEYTQAAIEARMAAEANLANVVAAGRSRKCADVRSAMQSVQLFIPYLEKLALDISKRPLALGPQASRRALESTRAQLIAAANRVYRDVGETCVSEPPAAPETEAVPGAPPAGPEAPAVQ